jgi:2-aminoadipate transaminase
MDRRIDELQRRGAAAPGVIGLGGGLPAPELFPRAELASSFFRAIRAPRCDALQYGWPEGREKLRSWVAKRLRRRGADIGERDVIITSGAQQALDLAVGLLFEKGDRIACDRESYPGALDLFRARGLKAVIGRRDVAGLYVMPKVSNPRGETMDEAARSEVLRHARRHGTPILEDDAYADLHFESTAGPPLLARDRRHVWHVGTLSKTVSPGLRVGWLVPPRAQRDAAIESKRQIDLQANSLSQTILEDFVDTCDYDAFTGRAARFYARRARRLARALRRHLKTWKFRAPEGGFSIWAETNVEGDDTAFLELALKRGVSFDPGSSFRSERDDRTIALRLAFSTEPGPRIEEGVARLARAWRAFLRTS